jgi:casein kinase II subunit beta
MSQTWLESFLREPSSAYFVEIPFDYISDTFNSFGLADTMHLFSDAFLLLRENRYPKNADKSTVNRCAEILYGLLHQRFLATVDGQDLMHDKYRQNVFPRCPRIYCRNGQKNAVQCLPFGISDRPGVEPVMLYCPGCKDVYRLHDPVFAHVDGAYFGPSYVHLLLQHYPLASSPSRKQYVPRIFGFGLCQESDVNGMEEDDM